LDSPMDVVPYEMVKIRVKSTLGLGIFRIDFWRMHVGLVETSTDLAVSFIDIC